MTAVKGYAILHSLIVEYLVYTIIVMLFIVDYDAPLSEAGDVTKKYRMLRDVIVKYAPASSGQPRPP